MLPLSFREAVGGLRGIGFLDFFVNSSKQTNEISPESKFWLMPGDFNFLTAFLPLLITILGYSGWFLILLALKKWVFPRSIPDDSRTRLHKISDSIICRFINFIDTICRYMLVPLFLVCMMEFVGAREVGFSWELILAAVVLLSCGAWCVYSEVCARNQYYENEYSHFIYLFEDKYFCRIPLHSLPSRHHRMGYPLLRVGKAILFVMAVTLSHPLLALAALVAINSFELWYLHFNYIYSDARLFKFKAVETILLLVTELLLFVLLAAKSSLSTPAFKTWGYVLATAGLLLMLNCLVRVGYIARRKYAQMNGINF